MTEPSTALEAPDVAETVGFLRRFAGLMANGYNAAYLQRAADLLETLIARVVAASDEDKLWRYKYETLSHHADALEAECEALKHDIEGHLDITSAVLAERDALAVALRARETELSELCDTLSRERDERAAKSAAHEQALSELRDGLSRERDERAAKSVAQEEALAGLRLAFDQKREALQAALEARGEECDRLRRDLERERDDGAAKLVARETELSELRRAFDRERGELQAEAKARGDELATFRTASERELDALREKVASLEARRAELRAAFDRINQLRNQTLGPQAGAESVAAARPGLEAAANPLAALSDGQYPAAGETNAVVPKTTLRQARAQFEYLAREFIPLGDIASQVMCELGAYTMDIALVGGQPADHLPADEVARRILAPVGPDQT